LAPVRCRVVRRQRELIAAVVRALGGATATKDGVIWEQRNISGTSLSIIYPDRCSQRPTSRLYGGRTRADDSAPWVSRW
jgi:hypothetical protein